MMLYFCNEAAKIQNDFGHLLHDIIMSSPVIKFEIMQPPNITVQSTLWKHRTEITMKAYMPCDKG